MRHDRIKPVAKPSKTVSSDKRALRNALGRFATGVAVVTTSGPNGKPEGLTINSFSSVSLEPPLVLWSLKRDAPSLPAFVKAGKFSINVLAADQCAVSNHFSTTHADKFESIDHQLGSNSCPRLHGTLAHFECETVEVLDGGDHAIFLGQIHEFEETGGEPLLFSGGRYCQIAAIDTQT